MVENGMFACVGHVMVVIWLSIKIYEVFARETSDDTPVEQQRKRYGKIVKLRVSAELCEQM